MQQQEHFEVGGIHAFVVDSAAAVEVPVFDHCAERIHRPEVRASGGISGEAAF